MGEPIGPGDWVECTRTSLGKGPSKVVAGQIYRVRAFRRRIVDCPVCGQRRGSDGIDLESDATHFTGWCPCRFRPIYRPKADLIESLKAPPKVEPLSHEQLVSVAKGLRGGALR